MATLASMSAGGRFVLESAKVFDSLAEAVSDLHYVFATSSSKRDMDKAVCNPWDLRTQRGENIGFLFGCERSGLTNAELALCDCIITIPTSTANKSMNLAQAVAVVTYEYSKIDYGTSIKNVTATMPAAKDSIIKLVTYVEKELDKRDFFKTVQMKPIVMRNFANMITNAQFNKQEIDTLFGMLKALSGD